MAFFDTHEPGEISARTVSDMGTIQEGITSKISVAFTALATFVAAFVISLIEHSPGTEPNFLIDGSIWYPRWHHSSSCKGPYEGQARRYKAASLSQEALSSMRHVFAFGLQEHLAGKYDSYLESARTLNMKAHNVVSLVIAWTNFVPILVFALCFWVGYIFLVRDEVSAGQLATIALVVNIGFYAILRIAPAVKALVSTVSGAAVVMGHMARRSTQTRLVPPE
ncbi:ABC transporter type 1, transmembrane domain-containing protein [Nemania serpens]|nr:ABC transporter type 1, transmembrane domain-containing protein [Nemania serpens]